MKEEKSALLFSPLTNQSYYFCAIVLLLEDPLLNGEIFIPNMNVHTQNPVLKDGQVDSQFSVTPAQQGVVCALHESRGLVTAAQRRHSIICKGIVHANVLLSFFPKLCS